MSILAEESSILEFRGRMLMTTVLHLRSLDLDEIRQRLDQQLAEDEAGLLRSAPLVLEFPAEAEVSVVDLTLITEVLRDRDMNLVAVARNGAVSEQDLQTLGIGSVALGSGRSTPLKPESSAPRPAPEVVRADTLVIEQPVRSGQQIYSRGDLICLAPVGTGAELLAEGNIHVYANLRGRALAGVRGNTAARVFCQQLNAELVSIAGHYRVSEDLPDAWRDRPVQISLEGETMLFAPIKR